jgi:hypothetical protein
MGTLAASIGTTEYRVVLVRPDSQGVLALASAGFFRLPRVSVPLLSRPAQQLREAIEAAWGITVFILNTPLAPHGASHCAVAEMHSSGIESALEEVTFDRLADSELTCEEFRECQLLMKNESSLPLPYIGWFDEAVNWVASMTGKQFSSKDAVKQLNAGGGFVLLRLRSDDGKNYWLKATGAPNVHELSITRCLTGLCPEFLPKLVATRSDWNAWLTEDAGEDLSDPIADAVLSRAIRRFASLQLQTANAIDVLLAAGAFDQRIPVVRGHVDGVVSFLIDAMAKQTSTKVAPLSRRRVLDLGDTLCDALCQMEALCVPDALIHNDLNAGNILYDGRNCVFTDWSEAAIGNPFLSLDRFRRLSPDSATELDRAYCECWMEFLSEQTVHRAASLAPLLSIFAYLYGRGDWLEDPRKVTPQFESYLRSLARHMDRAAQNPAFREALCR